MSVICTMSVICMVPSNSGLHLGYIHFSLQFDTFYQIALIKQIKEF